MKAEIAPRTSVIDALATGLNLAARRPALLIVPVVIDLGVWLAPRLSVQTLLQQVRAVWEALFAAFYSSAQQTAMAETVTLMRKAIDDLGQHINLMSAATTGWLAPPSAVVDVQATRLKLISDGVLAPIGLGLNLPQVAPPPWQLPAVEITSAWVVVLMLVGLWIVGQLLTTLYMRSAAAALIEESTASARRAATAGRLPRPVVPQTGAALQASAATEAAAAGNHSNGAGRRLPLALGPLFLRLTVLSLLLGIAVYLIRMPLALAMALAVFSGSGLAAGVFVLSGGLTLWFMLWFLSAVFFASEAILFEGQPLGPALWQALVLARASGWRTFGLIILVNVLSLGFRAMWGLIGQTPLGAFFSILANAYLATGLLLAIFIYYNGLRRELQMLRTGRRVIK